MFNITIENETAEALFRDILIQDWRGLKSEIAALEAKGDDIKPFESEELTADRRWVAAMETLMEYYLPYDAAQQLLNETTN